MRIFMVISQLYLHHGGAEAQALKLARALQARGHQLEILSKRDQNMPPFEVLEGVPVRRFFAFGNRRLFWRLGPYSYSALLLRELRKRRAEHDIVHAHQAFHPAFVGVLARRSGGAPVLVKIATAGEYGDIRQMKEGRVHLASSKRILRTVLSGSDALVAISSAVEDELLAEGVSRSRIVSIPNGVELPALPSGHERADARASLGLSASDRVAVYVGRSDRQKGGDLLLSAWGRVGAADPRAKLYVLGAGFRESPEFRRIEAASGGSLVLVGKAPDVPRYLKAANLFVLPSRGEGLSNALLEAMAHGVPALVSDLPANLQLVKPGETGLTVPVGDVAALSSALSKALAQPEELAPLARAARSLVESEYSMPSVAERYEQLYKRLLEGKAPRLS